MKIGIVLDSLARGGAERQALYATRELLKLGCDVELMYYNPTRIQYDTSFLPGDRVTYLPKRGMNGRFVLRLSAYFRQREFQLVHGFMSGPSIFVALAGRLARVPVILGGIRAEYDERGLIRMAHRVVNRLVNGWVVNSKATVPSLVAGVGAAASRIFVVYNGIDAAAFETTLSADEAKARLGLAPTCPVVSIIGVTRSQKNHVLFVKMASLVAQQIPEARFLVVGEEGDVTFSFLMDLAKSHDCREHIHFLGGRSDIPEILAATDVVSLTSHYEGVANALLEAMAVGRSVVSTGYAGADELVRDGWNGFVVPLGDAPTFADRVVRLLRDSTLRQVMSTNGKTTIARQFSMEAMGRNLHAVYSNCLKDAKLPDRVRAHSARGE